MTPRAMGILFILAVLVGGAWFAGTRADATARDTALVAWGTPGRAQPSTFDRPRCVSVAPDGTVYCLDLTGRIQHFSASGEYLGQLQMPDVSVGRPQGIDVDAQGFLYVADTHYFRVVKFAPSGEIVMMFGEEGTEPGKFFWPCAIQVADDGTIYTAEYGNSHDRIQKWSPEGKLLAHWGTFGTERGQFMRPMGLAFDSSGNVYVADAVNHRVQVFSPDGTWLRAWNGEATAEGRLQYPYDIAIDNRDRVYTVEYGGHRVRCFDATGAPLGAWGRLSRESAGFNHPWGLDVSPQGTVFVADTMNCRVARVAFECAPASNLALAGGATDSVQEGLGKP